MYSGPLQKQLSDNMYIKHSDVNYMYNTFSHLGVMESLTTVIERQKATSKSRNLKEEILDVGKGTYCHIHDNFNKMHVTGDPVYGSPQTRQSEILNRTFLVLPPTKSCPTCVGRCTCRWSSEKSPKEIDFRCIFQNDAEIKETKKFEEKRLYDGLKTVSRIYYLLQNLELSTTDDIDNILETSEDDSVNENDQHQTEADFPPELHLEEVLTSVKEGITTKKEAKGIIRQPFLRSQIFLLRKLL